MWQARWRVKRTASHDWRCRCALIAVTMAMATVWLVVLPNWGNVPGVREYIEHNEELGIDPAAKYYTELPCMPVAFDRVSRALHRVRDDDSSRRVEAELTPQLPVITEKKTLILDLGS